MLDERSFDEVDGFSRLEITAITRGVIVPVSPVFYRPLNPIGRPVAQYEHHKRLTKEAEETVEEIERERERIHRKYHPD